MPILALETSLGECSVALWKNGAVIAEEVEPARSRQTERIFPMIASVLKQAGLEIGDMGAFFTTSGPGSFTGIRIGLSAARGFTVATSIPTFAVSTLELLAWQAFLSLPRGEVDEHRKSGEGLAIATLINAYRGEVYYQSFRYDEKMLPFCEAKSLTPEEALAKLPTTPLLLAGDAATLVTGKASHHEAEKPSAAALARYAGMHQLNAADYPPQPLYIRLPDAKPQADYALANGII